MGLVVANVVQKYHVGIPPVGHHLVVMLQKTVEEELDAVPRATFLQKLEKSNSSGETVQEQ